MKQNLKYIKLDRNKITSNQFEQILRIEHSDGEGGYPADVMRKHFIEDENLDNFVCIDDNKIVGYITYNPKSKRRNGSIYIINLVILPEYRKQGIGQNLIYRACKFYLGNSENTLMSLQVDKDNTPALSLYKKVGFEIKTPICKADEDDEQYIMDTDISILLKKLESIIKPMNKRE